MKKTFKDRIKIAEATGKIEYYDYIKYKKAVGWKDAGSNNWIRPSYINKVTYNASFLQDLPNYHFLGISIRDLLRFINSAKDSHLGSIALSLCYDDFKIITCYLRKYIRYCNEKGKILHDFSHSFLLINDKKVIDSVFGIITDVNTYNSVFGCKNIHIVSSNDLKKTHIYNYIQTRKEKTGPSNYDYKMCNNKFNSYKKEIEKYTSLCKYYDNKDKDLESFIKNQLQIYSNHKNLLEIRSKLCYEEICSINTDYPNYNMISTIDDMNDFYLESSNDKKLVKTKKTF